MSRRSILLAMIGLWVAISATAQDVAHDVGALNKALPVGKLAAFDGGAQLVAAKGTANATIKVSKQVSSVDSAGQARFSVFSFTATAPLDKSGGASKLGTLDGLTNASTLEIGFSNYINNGLRIAPQIALNLPRVLDICKAAYEARFKKEHIPVPQTTNDCDSEFVQKYASAEQQAEYDGAFFDKKHSYRWLWGTAAKVGYQDVEYVTEAGPLKQKGGRTPWSVGLWGAIKPGEQEWLVLVNGQYQRAYKDNDAMTVCPLPTPGASSVICAAGPLGEPKQITKKLLTAEVRSRVAGIGYSIAVTRDFAANVTGIEIPVYFLADKDSKLTAGVQTGWRNDTKKASIGVFIGTPFSIMR